MADCLNPLRKLYVCRLKHQWEGPRHNDLLRAFNKARNDWLQAHHIDRQHWDTDGTWIEHRIVAELEPCLPTQLVEEYRSISQSRTSRYKAETAALYEKGRDNHTADKTRRAFSPKRMEKWLGPNWRQRIEKRGLSWEDTVDLLCLIGSPTSEELPWVLDELFRKISLQVPNDLTMTLTRRTLPESESKRGAALGTTPGPRTRIREQQALFEWLIRYQVEGLSKYRIAKNYKVSKQAVDIVSSRAKLIGLTLRSDDSRND
jgi:hypothetical protein